MGRALDKGLVRVSSIVRLRVWTYQIRAQLKVRSCDLTLVSDFHLVSAGQHSSVFGRNFEDFANIGKMKFD